MKRRDYRGKMSQIDMIPMIDIVFQLILFFLVSTTFVMLPGIQVNLPQSTTAESGTGAGITVTLNEQGQLWFNEKPVDLILLGEELQAFDTGDIPREEFPIQLEAGVLVTNGEIVKIFDVIRKSGFSAVQLRTVE